MPPKWHYATTAWAPADMYTLPRVRSKQAAQTAAIRFSGVLPPLLVLLVQLTILPDSLVVQTIVTSRMASDLQTAWLLQWISQSHRLGQFLEGVQNERQSQGLAGSEFGPSTGLPGVLKDQ